MLSRQAGSSDQKSWLCADSRDLFQLAASKWRNESLSGEALFCFCEQEAEVRGWKMMGRHMSGHRLSDFPHATYFGGKLTDASFPLRPNAWVLEICLLDLQTGRGAFFEDLLF